jgi:hypothetical protein
MQPKLLLCLQFWEGDAQAASSLLRLMADIAPSAGYLNVDLLVSAKRDCELDMAAIQYAGRVFGQTHTFRCTSSARGWPSGPNSQIVETWRWFIRQNRMGRWDYEGIWFIEPDGVPLRRSWLSEVYDEWCLSDKLILGFVGPAWKSKEPGHVNGNLVARRALDQKLPGWPNAAGSVAWDQFWDKKQIPHAQASRLIYSDYKLGTEKRPLNGCDHLFENRPDQCTGEVLSPAFLHGVKDFKQAHECIRSRLL